MLGRLARCRGAAMVFMLLCLVPLLMLFFLFVNVSWSWHVKHMLRVVADNAALSGASTLPLNPVASVNEVVTSMSVWGVPVTVQSMDYGVWSPVTHTFASAALGGANAVSVTVACAIPYIINIAPWSASAWQSKAVAQSEVHSVGGGILVSNAYLVE